MWLPVVVESLLHPPGNLNEVGRFFVSGGSGEPPVGLGRAGGRATEFRVLPPWLGGRDAVDPVSQAVVSSSWLWLLVPTFAVASAAVVASKHDDAEAKRTVLVVGTVTTAAVLTLSRITGTPFVYLFPWRATVGAFAILMSAWVIVTSLQWLRGPRRAAVWSVLLSVLVVVPWIGTATAVANHPHAVTAYESVTEQFVDELSAAGNPHHVPRFSRAQPSAVCMPASSMSSTDAAPRYSSIRVSPTPSDVIALRASMTSMRSGVRRRGRSCSELAHPATGCVGARSYHSSRRRRRGRDRRPATAVGSPAHGLGTQEPDRGAQLDQGVGRVGGRS